jgi:CheY-like chemotaxis protein
LLEDDPSQLELLGHWLALDGHDPHRFEYGHELLNALPQPQFDLLVLDWELPDMSGLEVLMRIRQRWNLPVIFCTARESEDSVVAFCTEVPMTTYAGLSAAWSCWLAFKPSPGVQPQRMSSLSPLQRILSKSIVYSAL